MINRQIIAVVILLFITFLGGVAGYMWGMRPIEPKEITYNISARRYAFNPERIVVNKGDKITVRLKATDVTHGFFLEDYDIDCKVRPQCDDFLFRHPSLTDEFEKVSEFSFVADKIGKFRYRCSTTCGAFHPFMQGELIVKPNVYFNVSVGMLLGLGVAIFVFLIQTLRRENEGN